MRNIGLIATVCAMGLGLSACISSGPSRSDSVEGQWYDPNGVLISFTGGKYEVRTTDTNTMLATGQYNYTGPRMVQISVRSLVSNRNSSVNCSLASPTVLNCTSDSGSRTQLTRRLS